MVRESLENILRPKSEDEIEQSIKNLSDTALVELVKDKIEILDIVLKRDLSPPFIWGIT